jgi:hypothetical protein
LVWLERVPGESVFKGYQRSGGRLNFLNLF